MKKLFVLMAVMIFFVSCNLGVSDSEYIDTVKNIRVDYGTLERAVRIYFYYECVDEKGNNLYKPNKAEDVIWKVEGNTNNGKIVTAEYGGIKIVIPTYTNGDYVEIYTYEIYALKDTRKIPFKVHPFALYWEGI